MNLYSFVVKDRYTQGSAFEGDVDAPNEHEAYEMARKQITDEDMRGSLAKGGFNTYSRRNIVPASALSLKTAPCHFTP